MKANFVRLKKGDRAICTHYKDRPRVTIDSVCSTDQSETIWVIEEKNQSYWWGYRRWFKKIPSKKKK